MHFGTFPVVVVFFDEKKKIYIEILIKSIENLIKSIEKMTKRRD